MNIVKIEIEKLPGRLPILFKDEYEIDTRLYQIKDISNVVKTDWNKVEDINVYTEIWDAYKLIIPAKESLYRGLSNINYGDIITITLDNGNTHRAQVLEYAEAEHLQGTTFVNITIDYKDLNSLTLSNFFDYDTYPDLLNTINTELKLENFKSDGITNKEIDTQWTNIITSDKYIVNSNLEPIKSVSNTDEEKDSETGTEIVNQTFIGNTVKFKGYFTTDVKNNLMKYLPLVSNVTLTYDSNVYVFTENISSIDTDDVGQDIHSIEFEGKIENLVYNHF